MHFEWFNNKSQSATGFLDFKAGMGQNQGQQSEELNRQQSKSPKSFKDNKRLEWLAQGVKPEEHKKSWGKIPKLMLPYTKLNGFGCRRRESDVPLTKTVVLPATVESDDPVTFSPDVLTHRPHHRVTGSGSQKCHAILKLHPAKEKYQQKKEKHWIRQ